MTISDIAAEFNVSRRTAERMRDTIEDTFGPLIPVKTADRQRHFRLQTHGIRGFIQLEPEEFVDLERAATYLDRSGLSERSNLLRGLATKLRAAQHPSDSDVFDNDLEMMMQAEGLAMYPLPRVGIESGLLSVIRSAIKGAKKLRFDYVSRGSGRRSQKLVEPYGVIYGNRPYLVAKPRQRKKPQLWLLTNMSDVQVSGESFELNTSFSLRTFAEQSFGVYQEEPLDVVLRFDPDSAPGAENFMFHPSQKFSKNDDGSLTVEFRAGGIVEICWHLVTWGTSVVVLKPLRLREHLAEMCAALAAHHSDSLA